MFWLDERKGRGSSDLQEFACNGTLVDDEELGVWSLRIQRIEGKRGPLHFLLNDGGSSTRETRDQSVNQTEQGVTHTPPP